MVNINTWVQSELDSVRIGDDRLVKRLKYVITKLSDNPESSLSCAFKDPKEAKALYRFLSNDTIKHKTILDAHRDKTLRRINAKDTVLLLQDTTSFNYKSAERIEGMGLAGSHDNAKGLIMHSALCVSTDGVPLGSVSQDIWTRDPKEKGMKSDRKGRNNSHKFRIEEKESSKWLTAYNKSIEGISDNTNVVTICDREADIYLFFHDVIESERDFIVRAGSKKRRVDGKKLLGDEITSTPIQGYVSVKIPRNTKESFPSRTATLSIKYCSTSLLPPSDRKEFRGMPNLDVYVVLAEEVNPPDGLEPIKWLLLTTIPVNSIEDAFERVQWYKHRWLIERYHFILKSGCGIEEIHPENVDRLKKVIAIYSIVAWRIAYLTFEARNNPNVSCEKILSTDEWQCLFCVVNKTSTIPSKAPTLSEAILMIAKLGGFMARKLDGEPGLKVIWRGLRTLSDILTGWHAAKMAGHPKDVGKE